MRGRSKKILKDNVRPKVADAREASSGRATAPLASEPIKLGLAAAIRHDLAYAIAADEKCLAGGDACSSPDNPAYRAALNGPEGVFTLAGSLDLQFAASGAVMF